MFAARAKKSAAKRFGRRVRALSPCILVTKIPFKKLQPVKPLRVLVSQPVKIHIEQKYIDPLFA
jgi:hypothetical protein